MEEINNQTKKKVIALKLLGYTNKEISEMTGVSTGSISNITSKLTESLHSDADIIIEFFRTLRKRDLSTDQILEALGLAARFKELGLDQDDAKSILVALANSKVQGVEPQALVSYTHHLLQLCKLLGIKPVEIPEYCTRLEEEIPKKRQGLAELERKIADAQIEYEKKRKNAQAELDRIAEEKKKILDENKATMEDLIEYKSVKQKLVSFGIKLSDVQKLSGMLEQAQADNYSVPQIRNYLQRKMGLNKINDILEARKTVLDKETKTKSTELQEIKIKLYKIKSEYDYLCSAIATLTSLAKKNVSPSALIEWNQILYTYKLQPKNLLAKLDEHGSMKNLLARQREEIGQKETKIEELKAGIKTLESDKVILESTIEQLRINLAKNMQELTEKSTKAIEYLHMQSKKEIESFTCKSKDSVEQLSKEAEAALESYENEIKDLTSELAHNCEEFGKREALQPIFALLSGQQVPKEKLLPVIVAFLELIKNCKAVRACGFLFTNSINNLHKMVIEELAKIPA